MEIEADANREAGLNGSTSDGSASRLISVALEALAETRACSAAEVTAESGTSNEDIIMDSLEAVCVVAALEQDLGITIPGVEDLKADQIASIRSVVGLVSEFLSSSDQTPKPSTSIAS